MMIVVSSKLCTGTSLKNLPGWQMEMILCILDKPWYIKKHQKAIKTHNMFCLNFLWKWIDLKQVQNVYYITVTNLTILFLVWDELLHFLMQVRQNGWLQLTVFKLEKQNMHIVRKEWLYMCVRERGRERWGERGGEGGRRERGRGRGREREREGERERTLFRNGNFIN